MKKQINLYKHLKNQQANSYRNVIAALNNTVNQLQSIQPIEEEDRVLNLIINSAINYYEAKLVKKLKGRVSKENKK